MKISRIFLAALLAGSTAGGETHASLEAARSLYLKAVEGDRDASRDSRTMLELLRKERPDDPRVLAYLGSVQVLESGRTMALWRRGKLAKEGLAALDKAVSSVPDHVEVRFLRAVSTYHLPAFFGRGDQCARDFTRIAPQVGNAARSGALDPRFAAAALYYHGLLLDKRGERAAAAEAWRSATRIAPESRAAADAAKRLKST